MTDDSRRYIPPGSCSWCGHAPHADACPGSIQTAGGKTPAMVACPGPTPRTSTTPYWRCHGTGRRNDEPCEAAGENWREGTKHMSATGHGITTGQRPDSAKTSQEKP